MLKEIGHCTLDTSNVVSRTRKRKITTYKDVNGKSEALINVSISESNEENSMNNNGIFKMGTIDFDNKENSLLKSALKTKGTGSKLGQVKLIESKINTTGKRTFNKYTDF